MRRCEGPDCTKPLTGLQQSFCSDRCQQRARNRRRAPRPHESHVSRIAEWKARRAEWAKQTCALCPNPVGDGGKGRQRTICPACRLVAKQIRAGLS